MANPEAQIIYKPHPDVLYGHRDRVSDPEVVRHLSLILEDMPLAQALETVDHAYTITSQGGFEALMRGIPVTAGQSARSDTSAAASGPRGDERSLRDQRRYQVSSWRLWLR